MNDQNFDTTGDDSPDTTSTGDAPEADSIPTETRPLGFWLRAVDALLTREFDAVFTEEGVTRRDWMLLNALSGDVDPGLADRLARRPKRLRTLEKRGWAEEQGDGTWMLTDEGRAARERLSGLVDGIRRRVADSVTPEDLATTLASLEAIARELGGDDITSARGFGRGRFAGPRSDDEPDFGRGFRPGFGPGFGPGFRGGFGPRGGFGFGPRGGFGPFGPGFRPGPGFDPRRAWAQGWDDEDGCHGHGHGAHHGEHAHGRHHHEHGGHEHGGHRHGSHHGWHHDEHGHEHGHDRRGHGKGRRDPRHAEQAYERGFDAGYSRAAAERA